MSIKKIKITYIIFQVEKALGFEWVFDHLDKEKFEFSVISIGVPKNTYFENFCKERNLHFHRIEYNRKLNIIWATIKTYFLLLKIRPTAVHCHLFEANLIGLTAAFFAGIKKRIFTRHHSTFHHTGYPNGVKYDKYCNRMATHIIAISKNVESILIEKENVPKEKITLIYHGFDLPFFYDVSAERQQIVQQKYNPTNKRPVIGVISRYTKWKGLIYILEAYPKILKEYPNALLVLANAKGKDKEIEEAIHSLPPNSYIEIVYENDNAALFKQFDVFIHVPIDPEIEAFGQIYIEALAVGLPSVVTLSGVSREFIKDGENALVVDFKNSEQIFNATMKLLENETLRNTLIQNGKKSVDKIFSLPIFIEKLTTLYAS